MYFGLQLEGTVHHGWRGMMLRAVLALKAREEIGRIAPRQEAERHEHLLSPFRSVCSPQDEGTHIQDGFSPPQ